jgi:transcription initiation factor TFIID subunit 1
MLCCVQNYYKRKPENDKGPKELKYGEVTLAHTSPFLGTMTPGQTIQARILHICLP